MGGGGCSALVDITVIISLHKLHHYNAKGRNIILQLSVTQIKFSFHVSYTVTISDFAPSYMANSSCKDANGEPKDTAVPDGMFHCKDSFL